MRSRRSAVTLFLFSSIVCSSTVAQQRDGASTAEPFSPTGKLSQFRGFASPRPTGQLPSNANFMYASVWAVWSAWSFCVNGQRIRVRACNTVRGFSCMGTNREVQFCDPNDPGVRTQRRRLPNSDYDVVDPWEADRQEAMKQLYTDPETDDDSDMPQLPPKLSRPSGPNSEFRARAAGVQTQSARLVPPHPVAHGHQFTESRRPPNENDGMPGATPEKMFGAKQFALRQKPQNPELQTLRGIGEKSLEGTDAKEKDRPRPLPVDDAAPKSNDEPLEIPPSKPINADMDSDNGQPLPPLSREDDVDTPVQLRNEGRQFLSVPGKMDPRTTMRPNPNLVTLKHQRSTTKGSSQPVTVTPSTTVIPPVLSTTTSRRPATVRPVPSIVETAVEDITGEELLSKEESDVVQSFFSNSGVQSRASGLTGGNRKIAKEQLLEKTPSAHSQSSTTVRPPMTSSISSLVSTISNESGEAEATARPHSSNNNDRHSQPVVHQEERFGFNDRELLRNVEEPNEVVDEVGLAAPFPQATRPRQPAQLMDHEEPGLAGPFFPENGLSSQQAQPPGHNELDIPHSEPGLSGPFFPERTEQDRQMIETSLKKFNGRGAALPPSINADKLEQHKSGALPPSVNVVHAQQRVFPQIQGDARQIKEPHTRSLDPDYSFMNTKVQGDADATQQKPERQKHRSSGNFGLTGMSMKRKQKVLHSGEKPGRILDKYHAASLPPHQSVHQFAAVSAVPPPPPPLDEDIPYKPQFRSSGGPKRRKLRKKIKKIRPSRPVPLLAEVFPGSTLAPVQASGYESSALAEVFPTAKTGQHGVQPADLSEDTAKALDWMLKNITKAAEVGDQHFLDQLGVHGAQYLEEKLHLVTAGDLQGGKGVFPQPAAQPYAPAQTPAQASVPAAATSSVRQPPGFGPQTPKKTEVAPARLRLPGISKPKPVGDEDSGYDSKAGVGHDANSRAFGWTSQKHSGEVQEPHVAGESRKKFSKGESGTPYRGKKSRRGGEYAGVTRLRSGVGNRIHGARTMAMDKDDDVPLKLDAPSNIPKDEQGLLEEIRRIEAQMNQMNQDIENFDADLDEADAESPVPEAQVPPKYPDDSAKDASQMEIHAFNSMDGRSVKGLKPFSKQNKVMLVEAPEETNSPQRTSSRQSAMDIELAPKNGFVPNKEPVTVIEDRTPGNPVEPVIMSGRSTGSDSEDFWNEWTVWGRCFCGKQVRTRTCNYVEGISLTGCEGNSYETRECEGGPCPAKKQKQKKNKLMVVEVEDTPSDHPRSYTLAPNTRTDRSYFKMHPLNAAQKVPTV